MNILLYESVWQKFVQVFVIGKISFIRKIKDLMKILLHKFKVKLIKSIQHKRCTQFQTDHEDKGDWDCD